MRIQLRFTDVQRQRAADLAQRSVKPAWSNVLTTALSYWPQIDLYLDHRQLAVRSPRSGNEYRCTRTTCTCEAHVKWGKPCWHKALAALVRLLWDEQAPAYRCRHCGGPMLRCVSYGGEPIIECQVCHHVMMAGTYADEEAWPTPDDQRPTTAPRAATPARQPLPASR